MNRWAVAMVCLPRARGLRLHMRQIDKFPQLMRRFSKCGEGVAMEERNSLPAFSVRDEISQGLHLG